MANAKFKDSDNNPQYVKASGTGADGNPFVIHRNVDVIAAGASPDIGATTDAAKTSDSSGSMIGFLRGLVKWAFERMPAALGQLTKAASLSVTMASDQPAIEVGRKLFQVTPTVTVSTSPAYTVGDSIGGKITLTNAIRTALGLVRLDSIMILDRSNQKPQMDILIFETDPSATSSADNAAFAFGTDDDLKLVARIRVATADYETVDSKALATIRNIGAILKCASGTDLYAYLVAVGTPTFATTTALQVRFGFSQN